MEAHNILKLVLISTFLLISIHATEYTDSQSYDTPDSFAPKSSASPVQQSYDTPDSSAPKSSASPVRQSYDTPDSLAPKSSASPVRQSYDTPDSLAPKSSASPVQQSYDTPDSLAPKSSASPFEEPTASEEASAPSAGGESSEIDGDSEEQRSEDDVDQKVKEICDCTDNPKLCMATVVPLLKGRNNHKAILQVAIKAGHALANKALTHANELAKKHETSPEMEAVFKELKESYSTVVENYAKTIAALSEGDTGAMQTMLRSAVTNIGDCHGKVKGEAKTVFSNFAARLTKLTNNCLAIISTTK